MAIYHLSVKPVSRAGGRSATAASAYRAAELVHDHTTGQIFDYTRRRGVEHSEIVLPTAAARRDINWAREREALWNAAERAEKRSNSRVAREYEVALPHELKRAQRCELVQACSRTLADRYGCAVDFAIHRPHREGDERNYHAHLLATTRTIEPGGLGDKTTLEWSDTNRQKAGLVPAKQEITAVRALWAQIANEKLRELALEVRIDHRSLQAQGIEREPTSHLGPTVTELERRGIRTEVGRRVEREGLEAAQRRLELAAERGRLEREERDLSRSIIDVTGDIEAARRERDLTLARATERRQGRAPTRSIEELQRQGREAWLALRGEWQAREQAPTREREAQARQGPTPSPSLDEQRGQAIEAWRRMREGPSLAAPEIGRNRAREQERDRGPELEGPEQEP